MTVPTVADRTSSTFASATAHLVAMPATVVVNDGLLSMFTWEGSVGGTITTPSGWTVKCAGTIAQTTAAGVVYAKVATGTEGGTTVAHTSSLATIASAWVIRINAATWSQAIADIIGATPVASAGTGNPDPPSVSWAWGSLDELVFAIAHVDSATRTLTSYPSSYVNGNTIAQASTLTTATMEAERGLTATASPENPGVFTMSAGVAYVANTVAVKGAPGTTPAIGRPNGQPGQRQMAQLLGAY